jgi:hypothetical protein
VEWNLEVQHTFGKSTLVSINDVGNHGYDILLVNPYLNAFCTTATCGSGFTELPLTEQSHIDDHSGQRLFFQLPEVIRHPTRQAASQGAAALLRNSLSYELSKSFLGVVQCSVFLVSLDPPEPPLFDRH